MADTALISGLLSNLVHVIKDEFSLFGNFKKEVNELWSTLYSIIAVLGDAERKIVREKDKQAEDWLRKLKNVAYEVRDIMDECTFEDLRLQVKRLNPSSSSTRIQVTNRFITRSRIGQKLMHMQTKLEQISYERQKLHLRESFSYSRIETFTSSRRQTVSISNNQVYGRDKEKKEIIDILLNNTSSVSVSTELSVLAIVGIGGIGKTTLVQMVFNDDQVSKHFDTKIWVCVSDEFDIKLVIKDIIEATTEKIETSLEILQKMLEDKLRGKRYLIVLDDVWNENADAWDQLRSILNCGSNGAFVLTTTRKRNVAEIMGTIQHFELSSLSENDCWLLFEKRAFMYGTPKTPNLIAIGKEIARKCKGVPLVAWILGSQLGFKSDANEWCRIRDREISEISQYESDLLPILSLSYYDLPYHLRICFLFCAIFPKDTRIEKERLIQLLMAHDLIPAVKNQEVEDVGNIIWKDLCWRSFFQDEKENQDGYERVYTSCKMHDLMHDLAQSFMKYECFKMDANTSSDGLGREIRHVTVMVDEVDKTSVSSLKKNRGLHSLMLHGRDVGNVTKEILSVLKELPSLRVLEVCRNVQYQDLRYVGSLKHLRYLNLSHIKVTRLPNSICDLLNLQTLNLNYCYELESLPRNTKCLISLRHLYLKGCDGLQYMPKGMGQLIHLKTLNMFVIGQKEKDGQLDELKELDICGSLKILNLGKVSDASIARRISMRSINELELRWTSYQLRYCLSDDDNETKTRHEKIGEVLEVQSTSLKKLRMSGYKGGNPPKWVGMSSPSVLFPFLEELSISKMMNLRELVSPTIPSPEPFPNLCKLDISLMMNLRELVSPSYWSTGAFPKLYVLKISDCPKLGNLPPHLNALKELTVEGECSDELLYSISNFNGLKRLHLSRLYNVKHIFNNMNTSASSNEMNGIEVVFFPLLEELVIGEMKNLRELVSPTIHITGSFPNLCKIEISYCPNLRALPPHLKSLKHVILEGECSDELLCSISNLSGLTHLCLYDMDKRNVLFPSALRIDDEEEISPSALADNYEAQRVRSTFQSLPYLEIKNCCKLRHLFDEGMILMQQTLKIIGCEKLVSLSPKHHHLQGESERTRAVKKLHIERCPELMISLEEFENLNINNSLQSLYIEDCPKLVSSEEAGDFITLLRSIRTRLGPQNFTVDVLKEEEEQSI
ncbi:putative disease resistance protein RGA3 [Impatiens glandulifera]|uniref:putative disease resistance protein RGA3 n=1 Tax=Impatiens glandulifera TaxID=253017 RepID=UPI001FB13924|nr:putative disease resistance protein RGA3 [Impatiens glandulifera]